MTLKIIEYSGPRVVRLVATARLRDPVLHLLLDDQFAATRSSDEIDRMAQDLVEIEGSTSARLTLQAAQASIFPGGRPHANFVNAAFAYWRPREPNRFNDASFGAWYAACATEVALAEVTYHIGRELDRAQDWNATVDWIEMWASFAGYFVDLRDLNPPPDCLYKDPVVGYPSGNNLARQARSAGHNGILYHSVRYPGGTCLVALWPHVVQSVTQGAIRRATWRGSREPIFSNLA